MQKIFVTLVILACFISLVRPEDASWNYEEMGNDWNTGVCATGTEQSPINIPKEVVHNPATCVPNPLEVTVSAVSIDSKLFDNGHSLQAEGEFTTMKWKSDNGNGYAFNFKAIQFHFHARSEHEVANKFYDLEMHIVHIDTDAKAASQARYLAVLGVMFQAGAEHKDNEFIAHILKHQNDKSGSSYESKFTEQAQFFKPFVDQQAYYHYLGGLTTPTCDEAVNWFILTKPIAISNKQLEDFKGLWADDAKFAGGFGNNRHPQPLGSRSVQKSLFKCEVPETATTEVGGETAPKKDAVITEIKDYSKVIENTQAIVVVILVLAILLLLALLLIFCKVDKIDSARAPSQSAPQKLEDKESQR